MARGILVSMTYDEVLADRVRAAAEGEPGLTERKMFGGLAFMAQGNMAVGVSSSGGLMLRIDPADVEELTGEQHVRRFEMHGREMNGWLDIRPEALVGEAALQRWVDIGFDYARSLPPK